jgi:hypothetical protein
VLAELELRPRPWIGTSSTTFPAILQARRCPYSGCPLRRCKVWGWVNFLRVTQGDVARLGFSASGFFFVPTRLPFLPPPHSASFDLAWSAITKYHRQGGLNNTYLFPIVLEAKRSKIKVLPDSEFGGSPLPGLSTTVFLWCAQLFMDRALSLSLSVRTLILSWETYPNDFI